MKKKLLTMLGITMLALTMVTGCGANADDTATEEQKTEEQEIKEQDAEVQEESDAESHAIDLEDGVYTVDFDTDSAMFHVNESCEGKGTLTVENGEATLHITLVSKKIVNLFPGTAEDAQKEGAEILEPTIDSVTYSDGFEEEVYGFDVPVSVIGEEFDLALIGTKGNWYDHKVSISNPELQ